MGKKKKKKHFSYSIAIVAKGFVYKLRSLSFLNQITKIEFCPELSSNTLSTLVTQRQPARQRRTNATEIRSNTYLATTCHGSVWSVASCSRSGIYTLFPPVDFNCVCCCQSRWLSRGIRCANVHDGNDNSPQFYQTELSRLLQIFYKIYT